MKSFKIISYYLLKWIDKIHLKSGQMLWYSWKFYIFVNFVPPSLGIRISNIKTFEFYRWIKTFVFLWSDVIWMFRDLKEIILWYLPSSIQTIMEFYEINGESWRLWTKRNVASVCQLLFVSTFLTLLWILNLSWDQHTDVESVEECEAFYDSIKLLSKG